MGVEDCLTENIKQNKVKSVKMLLDSRESGWEGVGGFRAGVAAGGKTTVSCAQQVFSNMQRKRRFRE